MNGIRPVHADQTEKKKRNYKLIIDPALKQGPEKVYRYEGIVPGVSFNKSIAFQFKICWISLYGIPLTKNFEKSIYQQIVTQNYELSLTG